MVFTEGETAYLDQELVAEVQDPDDHGGDSGRAPRGCARPDLAVVQVSKDGVMPTRIIGFEPIVGETTNRYTPVEDDRGEFLRVTATYTDPFSEDDVPTRPTD